MEVSPTESTQTRWLNKNGLIRPGVYVTRESWRRLERALQVENFHRAEAGKEPITRTNLFQSFITAWSDKRLGKEG